MMYAVLEKLLCCGRKLPRHHDDDEILYTRETDPQLHDTWSSFEAENRVYGLLNNEWKPDPQMRPRISNHISNLDGRPQLATEPTQLCDRCRSHLPRNGSFPPKTLLEIQAASASCGLCLMVHHLLRGSRSEEPEGQIMLRRDGSAIYVETDKAEDQMQLNIASLSDSPPFPISGSQAWFEILRSWVQDCDDNHSCIPERKTRLPALPTRVIDVGDTQSDSVIRIRNTEKGERGSYIAVSHRWGDPKIHEPFCTFKCNIESRLSGFPLSELPQTFRDVVLIARELRVRHVWIDSLCIIQQHPDCSDDCGKPSDDFRVEGVKMEEYYSGAYLTVAATAAEGNREGLLAARRYAAFRDSSGSMSYVYSRKESDFRFREDVQDAALNSRAWVLQERALSRRIMHFAGSQVYWECGQGVCQESSPSVRLQNNRASFLSDPDFPTNLPKLISTKQYALVTGLYEQYTTFGITRPSDRPVAISGLQQRLATRLQVHARHGTFDRDGWRHRTLLWHRPRSEQSMQRLGGSMPTWSWLAHSGVVSFKFVGLGPEVFETHNHVQFEGETRLRVWAMEPSRNDMAWRKYLHFDSTVPPENGLMLAIIARTQTAGSSALTSHVSQWRSQNGDEGIYLVLVIAPARSSVDGEAYERVGAGLVFQAQMEQATRGRKVLVC